MIVDNKKLFKQLCHRGMHPVFQGDLTFVGVPGTVYTPQKGTGFPLVIFAHDWATPIARYTKLFQHLASWGIVVAAPNSQNGLFAADSDLARSMIEVEALVTHTRLGTGEVSINPYLLGFMGHGFGANAAVIAASSTQVEKRLRSLTLAFPKPSSDYVYAQAAHFQGESLVLSTQDYDSLVSNAGKLALSLDGDVQVKSIKKARQEDLITPSIIQKRLLGVKPKSSRSRLEYGLITGFLLSTLMPKSKYRDCMKCMEHSRRISDIPLSSLELSEKNFLEQLLSL